MYTYIVLYPMLRQQVFRSATSTKNTDLRFDVLFSTLSDSMILPMGCQHVCSDCKEVCSINIAEQEDTT